MSNPRPNTPPRVKSSKYWYRSLIIPPYRAPSFPLGDRAVC
jgi:hypothetical protein